MRSKIKDNSFWTEEVVLNGKKQYCAVFEMPIEAYVNTEMRQLIELVGNVKFDIESPNRS